MKKGTRACHGPLVSAVLGEERREGCKAAQVNSNPDVYCYYQRDLLSATGPWLEIGSLPART